jgi:hypothetical protein
MKNLSTFEGSDTPSATTRSDSRLIAAQMRLIERSEEFDLEVEVFRNRFENEPRAVHRRVQISGSGHFAGAAFGNGRQILRSAFRG